jgi:hypothetical protein
VRSQESNRGDKKEAIKMKLNDCRVSLQNNKARVIPEAFPVSCSKVLLTLSGIGDRFGRDDTYMAGVLTRLIRTPDTPSQLWWCKYCNKRREQYRRKVFQECPKPTYGCSQIHMGDTSSTRAWLPNHVIESPQLNTVPSRGGPSVYSMALCRSTACCTISQLYA